MAHWQTLPSTAHRETMQLQHALDTADEDVAVAPIDLDSLYREHAAWAKRVALRILDRPEDADDLVSTVFLGLVTAVQRGGGPRESVRAYLRTALRNEATRMWRDARRERLTDTPIETPVEDTPSEAALVRSVREAMVGCPSNWPQVICLVDIIGLTGAQAAKELGMTPAAVASSLFRARRALRERLNA